MVQRILEPGQIEALASRSVPRLVLPARERVFAARAARLEALAVRDPLGGYLTFAAALAHAQHDAAAALSPVAPDPGVLAAARAHGMPILPARGLRRGSEWRDALAAILAALGRARFPAPVAQAGERLGAEPVALLEARAERLLAADGRDADPAAAPFVIAALQVYWVVLASGRAPADVPLAEAAAVCPVCGMLPVASIVRSQSPYAGYRYLQCGLCASEWHRVRVECTQCGAADGISYQSIEGGPAAIRAETCERCRCYRKIFYQEHDDGVEAVADDLASMALDLLLAEAGYQRASAHPLLWQPAS